MLRMLACFLLVASPALAHDAIPTAAQPEGWKYSYDCCSGYDCRRITGTGSQSKVRVAEGPNGYVISTTGETIPYNSPKLRDSPDGEFHWCSAGGRDDTKTICLYVPPRGF